MTRPALSLLQRPAYAPASVKLKNEIINNIKCGFFSLSHMNWVSASRFHLSLAGVLGVVGLILALVKDPRLRSFTGLPWLLHIDNPQEKLYLVPGLQNLGNNCFLNVILQALASCSNFQPCLKKVIEESESSSVGECNESLQLTVALSALLEELSAFGDGRVVLSPGKVMLEMANYIQNFNLTRQQDAEEAFLHLLSSLKKEFSDSYPPNQSSLADAFASHNCRVITPKNTQIQNEQERWQQHFLGPFDGIQSSILTCHSCSSQISMNFQFFHSLPLSPVLEDGSTIMAGCALEDCLKQYFVAERVENYNCSHCWHIAAANYLYSRGANEVEIEKLKSCSVQDSCECRNLYNLQNLPWASNISCTLKKLSIARCPKILCIHLQRVSISQFGELIKLQGHIKFPLILNLLPFTLEEIQHKKPSPPVQHFNVQSGTGMINCVSGRNIYSNIKYLETFWRELKLPQTNDVRGNASLEADDEISTACKVVPSESQMYQLVSVVEHFGKTGGGHYTVYRGVKSEYQQEDNHGKNFNHSIPHWFCISDSQVGIVTEEDVLAAEASLLFYERIVQD